MLKDQKGAFQIMAGLLIALIVVTLLGGMAFLWQRSEVKRYKAENVRLATDNETLAKAKENQFLADAKRIKAAEDAEAVCLERLGQCAKPIIIDGCPTITKITDKNDPTVKEIEAMGWEVQ